MNVFDSVCFVALCMSHVSVSFEVNLWSGVNYCVNRAEHHRFKFTIVNSLPFDSGVARVTGAGGKLKCCAPPPKKNDII